MLWIKKSPLTRTFYTKKNNVCIVLFLFVECRDEKCYWEQEFKHWCDEFDKYQKEFNNWVCVKVKSYFLFIFSNDFKMSNTMACKMGVTQL